MVEYGLRGPEARLAKRPKQEGGSANNGGSEASHNRLPYAHTLLRPPSLRGRGNSQVRAQALLDAQQRHGNRAVQRSTSMPQPQGLEELVRALGDRETGGALGMLGGIVGDVATDASGLMGTLEGAISGLMDGASGAAQAGAGAEGSAYAGEGNSPYGHNTASTAREAGRSAASTGRDIPLDRATLEKMYESGMW